GCTDHHSRGGGPTVDLAPFSLSRDLRAGERCVGGRRNRARRPVASDSGASGGDGRLRGFHRELLPPSALPTVAGGKSGVVGCCEAQPFAYSAAPAFGSPRSGCFSRSGAHGGNRGRRGDHHRWRLPLGDRISLCKPAGEGRGLGFLNEVAPQSTE